MSELYNRAIDPTDLVSAVKKILDGGDGKTDLPELLADQISAAFTDGLRVGLNMRCNDLVSDVPKVPEDSDVLTAIKHTDLCVLQAQAVCFGAIPGIIELPEVIADYGHRCYAAGFDKGYEEGFQDGALGEEAEEGS